MVTDAPCPCPRARARRPPAPALPQVVPPVAPLDKAAIIADELKLPAANVAKVLALVAEGATVPFMARYRKEVTGGMDEVQLLAIKDRVEELGELESRRKTVLDSIASQGKLTDALFRRIAATLSKTELEDLYLPYKPKRRTRAMIARERGLEPLADILWAQDEARAGATRDAAARPRSCRREKEVRRRRGGLGRRARHRRRAHRRERRRARGPAPAGAVRRRDEVAGGGRGQRAGTDEVQGLLRVRRAGGQAALAPDPGAAPRRKRGLPAPRADGRPRRRPGQAARPVRQAAAGVAAGAATSTLRWSTRTIACCAPRSSWTCAWR